MVATTRSDAARLVTIRRRMHELQLLMAARGTADPCLELVAEHRDLVRERNAINGGRHG